MNPVKVIVLPRHWFVQFPLVLQCFVVVLVISPVEAILQFVVWPIVSHKLVVVDTLLCLDHLLLKVLLVLFKDALIVISFADVRVRRLKNAARKVRDE